MVGLFNDLPLVSGTRLSFAMHGIGELLVVPVGPDQQGLQLRLSLGVSSWALSCSSGVFCSWILEFTSLLVTQFIGTQ